jgi:hypothetical protein
MKKIISKVILMTMILSLFFTSVNAMVYKRDDSYENFPDVIGTKYEDAVLYLKVFGYAAGYPDNTFKPDNYITRAELLKLAFEFSGEAQAFMNANPDAKLNKFADVSDNHWAKKYIEATGAVGIVSGYEDNTFRPDNNVTFAEALTILLNVHGLKDAVNAKGFSWPTNYEEYSYRKNITDMSTSDAYVKNATRGDIALIISKIRNITWN